MWAMFTARNYEFFRDRAAFGWNFLFPFLIIAGFAVIFGGDEHREFKVGVFPCPNPDAEVLSACVPSTLQASKLIRYIGFKDLDQGIDKLKHHKVDLLIEKVAEPIRYWVNETSPKGEILEKMLMGILSSEYQTVMVRQKVVAARPIRYLDWLFPGIIGMNMMFSALYGVGYVVVRYRKNGVLKRLKATPLTAFEYLGAQMLSRLFVLLFSIIVLWIGCVLIFDFSVQGSYLDLFVMFLAGSLSLIALGLVIASRGTSEEFANGLLNFITWPMMFLSEVWFSVEGAPRWVRLLAETLPLTYLLRGVRKIVNDGSSLVDVSPELMALSVFTLLFLAAGALLFSWNK
jgi:ABC-type multidrug transport system permease subunit